VPSFAFQASDWSEATRTKFRHTQLLSLIWPAIL